MKTSDNITVTNGRLKKALTKQIEPIIMPKVSKEITTVANNSKFKVGVMTKFYPYLDKCEIQVGEELLLCKNLHRYAGELIDFYTPTGDEDYCEILCEPCIIPRNTLNCLVLDIDDDSQEQIFVGYINLEEFIGINPAAQGNIKLAAHAGMNQYWIKFGIDGLDLRLPDPPVTNAGEMDKDMQKINYANSSDTYTKEEIDKMLEDLKEELQQEDDENEPNS